MSEATHREVAVLNAALELHPAERAAYLDEACAGDEALRKQVEALLEAHEQAEGFLEVPPAGLEFQRGARANVRLTEKPGDKIGHYKLLQQIGEGGCGVVYMAEQEEPVRRRVALKVVKLGMDTKQVIGRFEAERQALALMDHPNIAKVLDAGSTDTGRPYFVMELVRGVKVTEFCDENKLSAEARLKLFIQVCQAIQHAHQKGVIHRDIKPSNILVTINDGVPVPKVIDFGIAKATQGRLTDQTLFTAFEQFIGTPAYMSPEQAVMTSVDIDTRSDIYSLGVLLYELLTGKTPFDQAELLAAGLDEMRRTIREKEPLRPSTRLRTMAVEALTTAASRRSIEAPKLIHLLSGDLDWIAMKCLEKDRTRRYETANGLAADILRHLNCEPVIARPPSRLYEFQKSVLKHKVGFAATAAILVALAGGVVVSTWEAIRAKRAERGQTRLLELAQTKEKKSEQAAQLLKDIFNGVGPSVALGRDTKLLQDILQNGVERIGKYLTNQPELEVELSLVLAGAYRDLGLFDKMEEIARHDLQLARARLGEENESVAQSLISLGSAVRLQGQTRFGLLHFQKMEESEKYRRLHDSYLAEAERYCSQGLAMGRKLLGDENPTVANALYELANVQEQQSRLAEAETTFRQALGMCRKIFGNDHPKVANVLYELAAVLAFQDKSLAEAESLAREALAIQRKVLSNDHPEIARSLDILAIVSFLQGNWAEAETRFGEVVAMWRKLSTNERTDFATALHNLGYALSEQGKAAEAEPLFVEALAMRRKLLGNAHPDVADSLHKLAMVVGQQGRLAEAEKFGHEEVAVHRILGQDRMPFASALNNLGYLFMLETNLADAETTLRESVAMHGRLTGGEYVERGLALKNLAKTYQLEGKLADAEATYGELLTVMRKLLGNESSYVIDALGELAYFLQQQGRPDEARPRAQEALAIWLRHPDRAEFLSQGPDVKQVLTALGDAAAVESVNVQLLQRFRKDAERGDAAPLNALAWFLATCPNAKFRDGTNAVACAEKAVAATDRKNPGNLDTLAAAYAEAGEFAKASSTQKEALALPHNAGIERALLARLKLYESSNPYREAE